MYRTNNLYEINTMHPTPNAELTFRVGAMNKSHAEIVASDYLLKRFGCGHFHMIRSTKKVK